MRRRELLRLLLVAGVAGCTTGVEDPPLVAASPRAADGGATPSPSGGSSRGERVTADEPSTRASVSPADADPTTDATAATTDSPSDPVDGTDDAPVASDGDEPGAPTGSEDDTPSTDPGPAATPTEQATTEEGGRTVVAVGRDALGLPAPRAGGRTHTITGLAVHHTASPTAAASTAPGRFRGITRAHRDLGWVDVAYHWGVDVAGNVYELRDEGIAGDTRTDYDPAGWFLVVCEGNFEESSPPRAMLDAVADVLAVAAQRYDVDPATIRGHRDLAATLCPGVNLQDQLPSVREAVATRLAAGGVALRVDDDPARVAAIEAG